MASNRCQRPPGQSCSRRATSSPSRKRRRPSPSQNPSRPSPLPSPPSRRQCRAVATSFLATRVLRRRDTCSAKAQWVGATTLWGLPPATIWRCDYCTSERRGVRAPSATSGSGPYCFVVSCRSAAPPWKHTSGNTTGCWRTRRRGPTGPRAWRGTTTRRRRGIAGTSATGVSLGITIFGPYHRSPLCADVRGEGRRTRVSVRPSYFSTGALDTGTHVWFSAR